MFERQVANVCFGRRFQPFFSQSLNVRYKTAPTLPVYHDKPSLPRRYRVSPAVTVSPRQTSNTFFFPYKYPVLNASRSQFAVFQFKQPLLHFHSKPKSHTEKNHKILALHVYLNQSLF